MRIVVQRVKNASLNVEGREAARIERGLLLFAGIGKDDSETDIQYLAGKIVNLRIFEDEAGKMNLNVRQVNAEILSVPQFTLYADVSKGNRPGFEESASPIEAKQLWQRFNAVLITSGIIVKQGVFGAHMQVALVNDGPVTILLDSKD
jgi:D-tyrosyl-tRNA(Tyr) deacylase